jgi:hypothetical protein
MSSDRSQEESQRVQESKAKYQVDTAESLSQVFMELRGRSVQRGESICYDSDSAWRAESYW